MSDADYRWPPLDWTRPKVILRELAPGRRQARPWGQGLPERPCRCRRKKAA